MESDFEHRRQEKKTLKDTQAKKSTFLTLDKVCLIPDIQKDFFF